MLELARLNSDDAQLSMDGKRFLSTKFRIGTNAASVRLEGSWANNEVNSLSQKGKMYATLIAWNCTQAGSQTKRTMPVVRFFLL